MISLTLGPEKLEATLPGVYYSLTGSLLFVLAFVTSAQLFAKHTPKHLWPIPITLLIASLAWLTMPVTCMNLPQELRVAVPFLILGVFFLQSIFSKVAENFPENTMAFPKTRPTEFVFRFCFAGAVVAAATIAAKTSGPFWGAIIGGTFPASFGSQLMIFQSKHPASYLPSIVRTAPVGVISTAIYAMLTTYLYPEIGLFFGTVAGFIGSICFSLIVATTVQKRLKLQES